MTTPRLSAESTQASMPLLLKRLTRASPVIGRRAGLRDGANRARCASSVSYVTRESPIALALSRGTRVQGQKRIRPDAAYLGLRRVRHADFGGETR